MVICLSCIFTLTILNHSKLLTGWLLYALLGFFFAIMILIMIITIRKAKKIELNLKDKK
jgi:ABC-type multidrug transport system permease subunit